MDGKKVPLYTRFYMPITNSLYFISGDGLGKNNDGMSSALKPHLKFDKFGIGHDAAKEFTERWWEEGYNSALNNINVCIIYNNNILS